MDLLRQWSFSRKLCRLMCLILVIMPIITGCGSSGGSSTHNESSDRLIIYNESFSTSAETDSNGYATLDTRSFDKSVAVEVTNSDGDSLSGMDIGYQQNDGVVEVHISDHNQIYAPQIYTVDLKNNDMWEQGSSGPAIFVSGTLLVIGCALALYTGIQAGDALFELTDFTIENINEVDFTHTTIRCTVGEVFEQIPNVVTLANLPFAVASNVEFVASGGTSTGIRKLAVKKAIKLNLRDIVIDNSMMYLIEYLSDIAGRRIGEDDLVNVSFYHFALLTGDFDGLVSIELVEDDGSTEPINDRPTVYDGHTTYDGKGGEHIGYVPYIRYESLRIWVDYCSPDDLVFEVVEQPEHGSVTIGPTGIFDYEGNAGDYLWQYYYNPVYWIGTDTFQFRVCDGSNCSNTGTFTIEFINAAYEP